MSNCSNANAHFSEFIPLYTGLTDIWIGNGVMPAGQTYIDEDGSKRCFGGIAGYLYGKYHSGSIQELGFVSDYTAIKEYIEKHQHMEFSYDDWVKLLSDIPTYIERILPITNAQIDAIVNDIFL